MLTREHAIAVYKDGKVLPDRLTRRVHSHYAVYAEGMLAVYRAGLGKPRRELHRAVQSLLENEPECPSRRIEAFCKLLDDASVYDQDSRGKAAALRREVFHMAAPHHPLVREADKLFDSEEARVKEAIAQALGRPWESIEGDLFADVPDFHRLVEFKGYADGPAFLSRYNVAQVQAALYRATAMTIWAEADFKTILRQAKLAKLMHAIKRMGPGWYEIRLDGPASMLRETRRYGAAMAVFLPSLLACSGWRMRALIAPPWAGAPFHLDLSPEDGLRGHLQPPEAFDSSVEESFARKWGEEPREGWRLLREAAILHEGQHVFVPDFAFRHEGGREVLLEVIGFWTPEYLAAKSRTLSLFAAHPILLAVQKSLIHKLPALPSCTISYGTGLKVQDVLGALGGVRSEE